ncbi:MAG: mannose-6-phosphate isomerase [Planctomycetaceae bacterium]|nr:mannose-6-phosphate isomerase [Planctomycetaceae bacterium]
MSVLWPLRFEPVFRRYIWGGRRLQTVLGKSIGEGEDYAESWEVVDHGEDQSVVKAGEFEGATLRQIVEQHGAELLGRHYPQSQFPLLFKLLDCNRNLSVQVHPNDEQGQCLDPPDLGKTEAWVVLHAERGSALYAGLKRGFDREAFEREINRGTTELCLHKIEPRVGDCIFIPAGIVHALGEGLVVAEIQQASDTTFRIFDWNRVDSSGNPRPLHIEVALDVIDYGAGPVSVQVPEPTDRPHVERLVSCDKFTLDRLRVGGELMIGGDDRFHIVSVIGGSLMLDGDPTDRPVQRGETVLLPASCGECRLVSTGGSTLLDMYLPEGPYN